MNSSNLREARDGSEDLTDIMERSSKQDTKQLLLKKSSHGSTHSLLGHPDADDQFVDELYRGLDDNYELKKDNWSGGHGVVEQFLSRFHDRRIETAYYNYVTDTLLNKIKRRLFYSGLAVLLGLIWTSKSPNFNYPLLYSLVPAILAWGTCALFHAMEGAGGCWREFVHACWRDIMIAVIVGSYASIVSAEYGYESKIAKPEACPQCRLLWSYAWLLIMSAMTVMNSGLEHSLLHVVQYILP
jgi:hypothetical protein